MKIYRECKRVGPQKNVGAYNGVSRTRLHRIGTQPPSPTQRAPTCLLPPSRDHHCFVPAPNPFHQIRVWHCEPSQMLQLSHHQFHPWTYQTKNLDFDGGSFGVSVVWIWKSIEWNKTLNSVRKMRVEVKKRQKGKVRWEVNVTWDGVFLSRQKCK